MKKRLYDAKRLQLDVNKTIYFFPCGIRKNKKTQQLLGSLFGAVDETKSKPEASASVTCFSMNFTRWSSENSQYTCQPHIMGKYNKLEFSN